MYKLYFTLLLTTHLVTSISDQDDFTEFKDVNDEETKKTVKSKVKYNLYIFKYSLLNKVKLNFSFSAYYLLFFKLIYCDHPKIRIQF